MVLDRASEKTAGAVRHSVHVHSGDARTRVHISCHALNDERLATRDCVNIRTVVGRRPEYMNEIRGVLRLSSNRIGNIEPPRTVHGSLLSAYRVLNRHILKGI